MRSTVGVGLLSSAVVVAITNQLSAASSLLYRRAASLSRRQNFSLGAERL